MKKVLFVTNYYSPYISGMTEYVRILAEKLAEGYDVSVLTSKYDDTLPDREVLNGVKVVRAGIIARISKGTVSFDFISLAKRLSLEADVVNLHLPMLESGLITLLIDIKKVVVTYHCDINLGGNAVNVFIKKAMDFSCMLAARRAGHIIVTTLDYARSSRVVGRFPEKCVEIAPPMKVYNRRNPSFHSGYDKVVGFCGRIVEEKGIEYLIKAVPYILEEIPDTTFLIAGDYENVAGGSIYHRLVSIIPPGYANRVIFLGKLEERKMEEFYSSLDVFVLPSINSLEAFGIVQFEAMQCGTPVVASNLPGVRQVINKTGMGRLCSPKDEKSLACSIIEVLKNRESYVRNREELAQIYNFDDIVDKFRQVFDITGSGL